MGLRKRLFAAVYDRLLGTPDEWEVERRMEAVGAAMGDVLEIGGGTGANLPYFPAGIRLTVAEPNPHMAKRLRAKAAELGRELTVVSDVAERLPFPQHSFDSVVSSLVLCSVGDLQRTLAEVRRVLRPGGTFHFYEHVEASGGRVRTFQSWLNRPWRLIADGCNLNGDIASAIRAAGFSSVELRDLKAPSVPPIFRPHIVGVAQA